VGQHLGDKVLASVILDRLLHHCDVISINGPSYRLKDRLKPSDEVAPWSDPTRPAIDIYERVPQMNIRS
jgi:hypothetical protein